MKATVLYMGMENPIKKTNVFHIYSVLNKNRKLTGILYMKFQPISESWILRSKQQNSFFLPKF